MVLFLLASLRKLPVTQPTQPVFLTLYFKHNQIPFLLSSVLCTPAAPPMASEPDHFSPYKYRISKLDFISRPEDGGSKCIRNIRNVLPNYIVSHPSLMYLTSTATKPYFYACPYMFTHTCASHLQGFTYCAVITCHISIHTLSLSVTVCPPLVVTVTFCLTNSTGTANRHCTVNTCSGLQSGDY
jgi:hypothetical protein